MLVSLMREREGLLIDGDLVWVPIFRGGSDKDANLQNSIFVAKLPVIGRTRMVSLFD
jgi:hypothetical protein